MGLRWIQKELARWQDNPLCGIKLKSVENPYRWIIELEGIPGTLYAGEIFHLQIDFPEDYPFEPPDIAFLPPVPLHPKVYSNGQIIFEDSWSPAMNANSMSLVTISMLSSATSKERPPDDEEYIKMCYLGSIQETSSGGP